MEKPDNKCKLVFTDWVDINQDHHVSTMLTHEETTHCILQQSTVEGDSKIRMNFNEFHFANGKPKKLLAVYEDSWKKV